MEINISKTGGGLYHVIHSGNSSDCLFYNDVYKYLFITILEYTVKKYNLKVFAFSLLENNYHILVQCQKKKLSEAIQFLNLTYETYSNKLNGKYGLVFKDQFQIVIIKKNQLYLDVCRYIHLRPVEEGLVSKPDYYTWSSYNDYVSEVVYFPWLTLNYHSSNKESFRSFLKKGNNAKLVAFYNSLKIY